MPRRRSSTIVAAKADSPLFEFCIPGVPVSPQARSRKRILEWRGLVAETATQAAAAAGAGLIEDDIEIHLSEFSDFQSIDRDNMAKPVQDAMQGIVFVDDRQVRKLTSEWCDINGTYKVRFVSSALAAAFTMGQEFVWVRIYIHRPREAVTE